MGDVVANDDCTTESGIDSVVAAATPSRATTAFTPGGGSSTIDSESIRAADVTCGGEKDSAGLADKVSPGAHSSAAATVSKRVVPLSGPNTDEAAEALVAASRPESETHGPQEEKKQTTGLWLKERPGGLLPCHTIQNLPIYCR